MEMNFIIFLLLLISYTEISLQQPPDSPISIVAQALGLQNEPSPAETENTTIAGPVGSFEKYHNATEPSFLYIVQLELKTSRVDEQYAEIEKRLDKLVEMAFTLAGYKHRKQTPPTEITTSNLGYNTKILKKRSCGEFTYIHFVTYAGNEAILGEVVADDMTLLSKSQMSAILRYPLSKIISDRDIEIQSSTKLWFLIAIFGIGIILIALGWLCLFLFFNVCTFGYSTEQEKYLIRDPKEETDKKFDLNPKLDPVKPAAQQPNDTLPSDGSRSAVTTKKQQGLKKTTYTEAQLKLKRELDEEQERIRRTIFNTVASQTKKPADTVSFPESIFDKPGNFENKNAETGQSGALTKSEKRRRHTTKIGPITAVTATTATSTTTNEQERETSEISRVSSSVPTTSNQQEMDEFDVSNLPETSLKILKKKKGNDDNEDDVKSEPESDYGSSLDGDGEKSKDNEEQEFERSFNGGEHRVRPMTAKRQRTSLFGGTGIDTLPAQPRAWTVYQAGDMVEEFWNNSRMYSHPTPGSPTDDGIIEMISSSNILRYV